MQNVSVHYKRVRAFSLTNGLLGAWLIVAPFLTDEPSRPLAASAVAAGTLVIVSEVIRYVARHTVAFSWLVVVAGAWLIAAPWVFNAHTPGARTWNYVICGVFLAGIAAYSITSSSFRHAWEPGEGAPDPDSGLSRASEHTRRTIS
jgi:drug/metabolite transporter (DMT)-like permease